MVLYAAHGSPSATISDDELRVIVQDALKQVEVAKRAGVKHQHVALVPPDFTRYHSYGWMPPVAWWTMD